MRKTIIFLIGVLIASALAYSVGYYNGNIIHWLTPPPHYRINVNGTPDCTREIQVTNCGHHQWGKVSSCSFYWLYDGTTTLMPATPWGSPTADGSNVTGWYESWSSSPSTIAVNITWYQSNGHITETDQAFNGQNFTWSDSGLAGQMDIWNISTHETGHTLMLLDLYDAPSSEFTMYGYSSAGETKKRSLETDDQNGARFIYPGKNTPLLSDVKEFKTKRTKAGLSLNWSAKTSPIHSGFNVYRREGGGTTSLDSTPDKSGYVRINPTLITGSGDFSFLDCTVNSSAIDYLIADVDDCGEETFHGPFEARLMVPSSAFELRSYPNPARDSLILAYTLPANLSQSSDIRLRVYDLSGRTVINLPLEPLSGEQTFSLDTSQLPNGVYVASLNASGQVRTTRLIVAR